MVEVRVITARLISSLCVRNCSSGDASGADAGAGEDEDTGGEGECKGAILPGDRVSQGYRSAKGRQGRGE